MADQEKPKKKRKKKPNVLHRWRRASQFFFLLALNPYLFMYRGLCIPAMNCWACPAAAFGCPIGAIGNFLVKGLVPFIAIGLMLLLGALVGRLICGWVCPFGLIQDLMNKIPGPKLQFPKALAYGKYVALVLMVFLIPLTAGIERTESGVAASDFFFCNYCPAGTLEAAIPVKLGFSRFDGATAEPSMLAVADAAEDPGADPADGEDPGTEEEEDMGLGEDLFGDDSTGNPELFGGEDDVAAGDPFAVPEEGEVPEVAGGGSSDTISWFFTSPRMWVLYAFLAMFVLFRRPFCRGVCPIGASFALLNRFSFLRMRVKKDQCKACDICSKKCPVDNKVYFDPKSDDCIRCMECIKNCQRGGVEVGALPVKPREDYWE
jgi:ferredoxin